MAASRPQRNVEIKTRLSVPKTVVRDRIREKCAHGQTAEMILQQTDIFYNSRTPNNPQRLKMRFQSKQLIGDSESGTKRPLRDETALTLYERMVNVFIYPLHNSKLEQSASIHHLHVHGYCERCPSMQQNLIK